GVFMKPLSFKRHRFPAEVIRHAVWLYFRFNLSFRDVEELMAQRGIDVSYETIRRGAIKLGPLIARRLKKALACPIFLARCTSGRSISHCNRAVEARVEPRRGRRRSNTVIDGGGTHSRFKASLDVERAWAMKTPVIPAPTIAISITTQPSRGA